jgi:acyl-coenzyme A thioesterase PaaI-like protein
VNDGGTDDRLVAARNRAGRAVRDIGHALVGHEAPIELVDEVAVVLDGLSARLDEGAPRQRPLDSYDTWHGAPNVGDLISTFADRPISGASSPWGCDITAHREGDEAVARFTLRSAHEGAPGRSHGGIVAALFDDVMGFVIQIWQIVAFTGELSVRYERGVPLHRELVMRARLGSHHGRKVHMTADLWDGDARVATAKATFITITADQIRLDTTGD